MAPLEVQHLKNQSIANLYQFLVHLYLRRNCSDSRIEQSWQKAKTAICYPQTLLNKQTQVLLLKLLLFKYSHLKLLAICSTH